MWEPFGQRLANETASWKSGPDYRGTFSILSTCVITLLLCVYTSLHLDIPEYGKEGFFHQLWRKAIWVCVGLAAPELVTFIAFREMLCARILNHQMQGILQNSMPQPALKIWDRFLRLPRLWPKFLRSPPVPMDIEDTVSMSTTSRPSTALDASITSTSAHMERSISIAQERLYPWTMVHSYFAIMGGFVFEQDQFPSIFFRYGGQRLTPNDFGLCKLATDAPKILPDISRASIMDRSKADGFAKALVCIQASWFIAQTVGRLRSGLPISLLELNTLLHALCCLFIYLAWMRKPLSIQQPHVIHDFDGLVGKICAWMIVADEQSVSSSFRISSFRDDADGFVKDMGPRFHLVYEDDFYHEGCYGRGDTCVGGEREWIARSKECNRQHGRPAELVPPEYHAQLLPVGLDGGQNLRLHPGQRIHGFLLYQPSVHVDGTSYAILDPANIERLRLAQELRLEESIQNAWHFGLDQRKLYLEYETDHPHGKCGYSALEQALLSQMVSTRQVLVTGSMFACGVYGGIHLIAWNGPFSTGRERFAWKISCFIVASPGIIALLITIIELAALPIAALLQGSCKIKIPVSSISSDIWAWTRQYNDFKQHRHPLGFLSVLVYHAIAIAVIAMYAAARLYLIVECFINLAYLPEGVFKEPDWSKYVPHFGSG